jgi:hypothetical protein
VRLEKCPCVCLEAVVVGFELFAEDTKTNVHLNPLLGLEDEIVNHSMKRGR